MTTAKESRLKAELLTKQMCSDAFCIHFCLVYLGKSSKFGLLQLMDFDPSLHQPNKLANKIHVIYETSIDRASRTFWSV